MAIPIVSDARESRGLPNPKGFSIATPGSRLNKDFFIFGQFNFHKLFANEILLLKKSHSK